MDGGNLAPLRISSMGVRVAQGVHHPLITGEGQSLLKVGIPVMSNRI